MLHDNEAPRYYQQEAMFTGENYPPLTNRGVMHPDTPKVFSHIDYFSATYAEPVRAKLHEPLNHWLGNDLFVMERERNGVKHFRYSADMFPSGRIYWNEAGEGTGSYAVFSGDEWAMAKAWHKLTDDELLRRVSRNAASITRLDFCTNITAGSPQEALLHFVTGRAKTKVRKATSIEKHGQEKGFTAYFGSTQSEKMIRVYDKAAELKLLHEVLTRIELQVRGKPAKRLVEAMNKNGVKATGKTAIRQFCEFPDLDWFKQATESDNVEMSLTPAKETSFMNWLNSQVLPAIEKRTAAGEHVADMREWLKRVTAILEPHENTAKSAHDGEQYGEK